MAHEVQLDVSVMFLPHIDVYDLLLERPVAMWNIFVFTIKKQDVVVNGDIYASALWQIIKMCVGFRCQGMKFVCTVNIYTSGTVAA